MLYHICYQGDLSLYEWDELKCSPHFEPAGPCIRFYKIKLPIAGEITR